MTKTNEMIIESIVTTVNAEGRAQIAPMGVWWSGDELVLAPFKPSTTLDNLLETGMATVNFTDNVQVFAGCLTGRYDWPLLPTQHINGVRLQTALRHIELKLIRCEDDDLRPKCYCKPEHDQSHAPFNGFNRAKSAVLELAILTSRLHMLPTDKVTSEIEYLQIAIDKTAGPQEQEAWSWLMQKVDNHYNQTS